MITKFLFSKYLVVGGLAISLYVVANSCVAAESRIIYVQDDPEKKVNFNAAVEQLDQQWKAVRVKKIEIMHIPTNRMCLGNVSSSRMDVSYGYKLIVRDPESSELMKELMGVLRNVSADWSGELADIRWGLVFYDLEDRRLFSIYLDRTGHNGVVNGACVNIRSDALRKWAEKTLGSVLH
jgi:hypothetical protein